MASLILGTNCGLRQPINDKKTCKNMHSYNTNSLKNPNINQFAIEYKKKCGNANIASLQDVISKTDIASVFSPKMLASAIYVSENNHRIDETVTSLIKDLSTGDKKNKMTHSQVKKELINYIDFYNNLLK
jgi:hypothetical protein